MSTSLIVIGDYFLGLRRRKKPPMTPFRATAKAAWEATSGLSFEQIEAACLGKPRQIRKVLEFLADKLGGDVHEWWDV